MTQPSQIVQAKRVRLYLSSDIGATIPADLSPPDEPFFNVGASHPESARFRLTPEFEPVLAHQSDYPITIIQTADAAGIDIDLFQWNGNNFRSVFGGGAITKVEDNPGLYKFVPPKFGDRIELAAIMDVFDGGKQYRFVAARTFNQSEVELALNKTPQTQLPLRLTILGGDEVDAFYMLTNDPAFDIEPAP